MENEKIFEFMSEMYADLKGSQEKMYAELKKDLEHIRGSVAKIEVEHGQKLSALFDGYVQNSKKLDRIEAEVAKHEEFIIKRIK